MPGEDKVMHPVNKSREAGIRQVKSSVIEGPTATPENSTPYNRKSGDKKKY